MKMNKILQALFILLFSVQFATAQSYNTLTATDKPVSVVLSDKSKVCVNHAGTIVYPSAFSKKQNTIEIKGEAYVEVHSAALKAITVDDLIVKGLPGAGFNIAAYEKDSIIKITAVEKSITIKAGSKTFLLHAGEQVLINRNHEITIQQVNVSEVISWMNQIKKEKGK